MKTRMRELWQHSQQVASLSRLLAKRIGGFDVEQAQLAGLVHDLGEVAILQYAQDDPELYDNPQKLLDAIQALRAQITGMLLNQWRFNADYVTVGEENEQWFRNPGPEADLCDLVLVAQYHAYIGKPEIKHLPPVSKLPAFAKLGMNALTPADIVDYMRESRAEYEAIAAHLESI